MTQAEYDQWLALAKDTAWKEFAARSPAARDLLDAAAGGQVTAAARAAAR